MTVRGETQFHIQTIGNTRVRGFTKNHANRRAHNWAIYDGYERIMCSDSFRSFLGDVIYDLGCGEAPYRDCFLKYAHQYIGVDWASSYHDTRADIDADLNKPLPIESGVADTVVSLSVLEHLCEPQVMLNESHRILKPGGAIVLQVPWQWWVHEEPYDFYRYSPYGLKYLLEKAGFVDVVVEPQSGFFTMWILKMNYFSLRLVRGPRPLPWLIKACLVPIWFIGQLLAPTLDKLDRHWAAETSSYFATARKPTS